MKLSRLINLVNPPLKKQNKQLGHYAARLTICYKVNIGNNMQIQTKIPVSAKGRSRSFSRSVFPYFTVLKIVTHIK